MIRALYAFYLTWLNALDEKEVRDRSIDGSASTAWCAEVNAWINARQDRIDALRAPRFNARGVAA